MYCDRSNTEFDLKQIQTDSGMSMLDESRLAAADVRNRYELMNWNGRTVQRTVQLRPLPSLRNAEHGYQPGHIWTQSSSCEDEYLNEKGLQRLTEHCLKPIVSFQE